MAPGQNELELSFMDQQPHIRVYGRYYVIFPFLHSNTDAAISALRTGFSTVLDKLPYLAGTVAISSKNPDRLQVLYPFSMNTSLEANCIFTSKTVTDPAFDYNHLAKSHFAPELFPAEVFCPKLIANHPGLDDGDPFAERMTSLSKGISLPAFACQANFIPGGLILSVWFYHAIADGAGQARILEVWCDAVRALGSRGTPGATFNEQAEREGQNKKHDASAACLALVSLADGKKSSEGIQASSSASKPLREGEYQAVTKLFRFPSSTIKQLSGHLSDVTKSHISHFAALSAVIWANVLRARSQLMSVSGNTQSTLAVVVDLRRYLPVPFSDNDYLGNLVMSSAATCKLEADRVVKLSDPGAGVLKQENVPTVMTVPPPAVVVASPIDDMPRRPSLGDLADLATLITKSVEAVDKTHISSRFHKTLTVPFDQTQHGKHKFGNGPDLYITSWQRMGADREWCIPGTGSKEATCIRRAAWVSEGGIVVLPKKERDGEMFEVMISLAEEDMRGFERGLREGGWLGREEGVRAKL